MPDFRRWLTHPYLLLVVVMLSWAGNSVVGRAAVGQVPPVALAFWRWVGAGLLLLPFAWRPLRGDWPMLRRHWPVMLLLGIAGIAIMNTLQYLALQWTTSINGSLVNAVIPALVVIAAWAIAGERPRALQLLGLGVSLLGVIAIIGRGDPAVVLALDFNRGDLVMLIGVSIFATYTVLLRWQPRPLHPLAFITASIWIGVAAIAPFYAWELAAGRHIQSTPASLGCILYAAIFPSALAYLLYLRGVRQLGATTAGHFNYLIPVFTAALAILFLGERLHGFHLAGAAAILGGIWLATRPAGR